nr:Gag-Pol polyprotein [Tanacetum cinerariifolium]
LEQVIGNPSQSVRTRRQLESNGKMCMFALTLSRTEPKNIKEAMADSAWIESMQEELHRFDRLESEEEAVSLEKSNKNVIGLKNVIDLPVNVSLVIAIGSNTNNNMQTQTSNTLNNAIMEAGSKDRPSVLVPGNYVQWKSRIKRYIDTKHNHELIHHCLKNPPYKFTWADKEVLISEGSLVIRTESYMETYKTVSQDIRDQLNAEAEAV